MFDEPSPHPSRSRILMPAATRFEIPLSPQLILLDSSNNFSYEFVRNPAFFASPTDTKPNPHICRVSIPLAQRFEIPLVLIFFYLLGQIIYHHYRIQPLCRVPVTLGKHHSAKPPTAQWSLPSVGFRALGIGATWQDPGTRQNGRPGFRHVVVLSSAGCSTRQTFKSLPSA